MKLLENTISPLEIILISIGFCIGFTIGCTIMDDWTGLKYVIMTCTILSTILCTTKRGEEK